MYRVSYTDSNGFRRWFTIRDDGRTADIIARTLSDHIDATDIRVKRIK